MTLTIRAVLLSMVSALVVCVLLKFALPGVAWAAEVTLKWDESPTATGYEIEQSVDAGATWAMVADLPPSVCVAGQCQHLLTAPATGLVMFRFVAKNAAGRTVRYDAGSWHCESCLPPSPATNVGVQ